MKVEGWNFMGGWRGRARNIGREKETDKEEEK